MTVVLGFEFDAGYCLMDRQGYMVCATWFDSEEAAVEYCDKQGWEIYYLDEEE